MDSTQVSSVQATAPSTSEKVQREHEPAVDRLKRVALVTGANRGLGFETARQLATLGHRVILTSRDPEKGRVAADCLLSEGLDVVHYSLDVTHSGSIAALRHYIQSRFGRLDILINNAAVHLDPRGSSSVFSARVETLRETMETNVYGPLQLCQTLVPLMEDLDYGRIVNVSSGLGQLATMGGGYPAYRLSKAGLNVLTLILANELSGTNILVNAVCPGWDKTDKGGIKAPRAPQDDADTVVWLATLPCGGPTGGFFRDREPIPW